MPLLNNEPTLVDRSVFRRTDQVSGILHTLVAAAQEVKATALVLSECTAVDNSSVRPLVSLDLRLLDLSNTGVTDTEALQRLTNLQWLDLRGTGVTDEQVKSLKAALPKVEILN